MSWVWAAGSRIALLLTAVLVLVMPWTEYFWHFDKFLHGGQDFELGLLSVATFICLILVMLQHGKREVTLILAIRTWICFILQRDDDPATGMLSRLVAELHPSAFALPALGRYTLPIRV